MIFNDNLVTFGFGSFNNWVNEFCIKVPRTICESDFREPLCIYLMFLIDEYEQVVSFGIGHILKICHYLYVTKFKGHEATVFNIDFIVRELEDECNGSGT